MPATQRLVPFKTATPLVFLAAMILAGRILWADAGDTSPGGVESPPPRPALARDRRLHLPPDVGHVTVPLRPADAALAVAVRMNDKEAGWFVVDTGAPDLYVDDAAAKRVGLVPLGKTAANKTVVELDRLDVGGMRLDPVHSYVESLPTLRNNGEPLFSGLLGTVFLRECPFTIDFAEPSLTVYEPSSFVAPPGAAGPFPADLLDGFLVVPGKVDGHEGGFVLDTGLSSYGILHSGFARRFRDLVRGRTGAPTAGIRVGGKTSGRLFDFRSLECLGRTSGPLRLSVADDADPPLGAFVARETAGMVGGEQLRDARLTVDYSTRRVWVQWPGAETAEAMARRLESRWDMDMAGLSPLLHAAFRRRADVVALLLARGGDPERADLTGRTPLTQAAAGGDLATVSALFAGGAKVEAPAAGRPSALHAAALYGTPEVVEALLRAGGRVGRADKNGVTPLHYAALAANGPAARLLIDGGADVNAATSKGVTPLLCACSTTDDELIRLLIDRGAEVDRADPDGITPLIRAVQFRRPSAVKLLLERGAAVNKIDGRGRTPLVHACKSGVSRELLRTLLDRGADPVALDVDARSAANYALEDGRLDLLDQLPPPPAAKPKPATNAQPAAKP